MMKYDGASRMRPLTLSTMLDVNMPHWKDFLQKVQEITVVWK